MPIKITINGQPATANKGKDELEQMLANGPADCLTRSVLTAIIDEIRLNPSAPAPLWYQSIPS